MQELLSYSLNTGDKYTTLEVLDMINKNNEVIESLNKIKNVRQNPS